MPPLRPLSAVLAAATLGGLLLSPVGSAGAAVLRDAASPSDAQEVREQVDEVRDHVRSWREDRPAPAERQASAVGCSTAPTGDVFDITTGNPATFPRADIVSYCVDLGPAVRLSTTLAEPSNPGDGSTEVLSLHWDLDVDGDVVADFYVVHESGLATVTDLRDGEVLPDACTPKHAFTADVHSLTLPSRCLGTPDVLHASVMSVAGLGGNQPLYSDFTEFSDAVAYSGSVSSPRRIVDRVAGKSNRYETAVAVSQRAFPSGASTVFIARGDVVGPDALVGGTLVTGPVLLVPQCGALPPVVAAEIRRIAPRQVVAIGGTPSVCEEMLTAAANA